MPSKTYKNLTIAKQDRILAALLNEFSHYSLADAQVDRIVKDAGIARGAFYKYFDDLTDAYQTLFRQAMAAVHHDVSDPTEAFDPAAYYTAVASFVDHFQDNKYSALIRRHYSENESLLPEEPTPASLSSADWAAMVLSHATIKAMMSHPSSAVMDRFRQALELLKE
ncbi:transcriptional regulator [Levilactobacillus senmaizukei DSM 21775 = NBRC 103853]|uniref:Transcriptional regulator n=1 Tax=Levilactobacillus senmaizukei DSM 21775 = NBRC 103853 TaxID=1423803 RepID=A0A0R2DE80_9LACO|nr:TetR/AcrR family transcriptional regulator [Levilactobacillus senmaizukei]KRN02320.1 transcriptional regulator [Levilactobacillus senmaizukei DSM 21775 = NBRC 103853]